MSRRIRLLTSRRECVDYLSYRVADRCLDGGGGFFAGDTRACRQMHLQLALLEPAWKSYFGHPTLGRDDVTQLNG